MSIHKGRIMGQMAVGLVLLAAGGLCYVLYRPATLLHHLWPWPVPPRAVAPALEPLVYSVPGGLWSAAFIMMSDALWRGELPGRRLLLASMIPAMGILSELMQAVGWLPGVADPVDALCYMLPLAIYALILIKN